MRDNRLTSSRLACVAHGAPRQRAAHALALFLLSAAHRQRPLCSDRSVERAADDTPQTKLDKLDAVLADTVEGKADFPVAHSDFSFDPEQKF